MSTPETRCELCGEPMPPGEEMFKFHGYSGPCPSKPKATADYYAPVPPFGSPGRAAYTLEMAQLRDSRDQWKARAEELSALQPSAAPSTETACGLTRKQLHASVARLDREAQCEQGTHEWGAVEGGVRCRWCRVLVAGGEATAIWQAPSAAPSTPPQDRSTLDSFEALRFAAAAIYDAIGDEGGLDGAVGEAVLRMIQDTLTANGHKPLDYPIGDADSVRWYREFLEARLKALSVVAASPSPERPTEKTKT